MNKALQAVKKTRKKATKKKTTRKAKVSKFNFKKFSDLIKNQDYEVALKRLVENTNVEISIKCCINAINNSSLRSYSLALKKFNAAYALYTKSGDVKIIQQYLSDLDNMSTSNEPIYSIFTDMRHLLFRALVEGDHKERIFTAFVLLVQIQTLNKDYSEQKNYFKDHCVNLACQVWPDESKGLKVLYGR